MDFNPFGTRAMARGLKAQTVLDTVARHFTPDRMPVRRRRGKFRKDDQSCKGVRDYLEEKYMWHINNRQKGRYEPMQIARDFWRP
jgi:hypothetical protein